MSDRRDIIILFLTRTVRMVAYGTTGVVLALYLNTVGLSNNQLGLLLTLTLLGDSAISLAVTRWADRVGRRLMLVSSCLLMFLAGAVYGEVVHPSFLLLLAAATVGVLSPSGNEVGPFMALEQSILAELVGQASRTHVFAWYNLVGYSMTAVGALVAGRALTWAQDVYGITELEGYRAVFLQYAASGVLLLLMFLLLTGKVERPAAAAPQGKPVTAAAAAADAAGAAPASSNDGGGDEEAALRQPLLDSSQEGGGADGDGGGSGPIGSFPVQVEMLTDDGSEHAGSEYDCSGDGATPRPAAPSQVTESALAVSAIASGEASATAAGVPASAGATSKTAGAGEGALGLSARSRRIVVHLSVLFATDSFAGGLVTGTLLAYYFQYKYGVSTAYLGGLLFGANLLAAVSSLLSGFVAARIGLINTMVFTHLPSNVFMLLVPLMPTLHLATAMVIIRFSISQMDVAPRTSYVAGVVRPDERTAAMGIVNIAKSVGAAFGPLLTGWLADNGLFGWAFYLCGGLKIFYDLMLLWSFSHVKPEH